MLCFWRESLRALESNAYTIFQSVLHVITFSNSKTTYNSLKVVLTEPNVTNGVQILNWKEITFSFPYTCQLQQITFVILQCPSWGTKWIVGNLRSSSFNQTFLKLHNKWYSKQLKTYVFVLK